MKPACGACPAPSPYPTPSSSCCCCCYWWWWWCRTWWSMFGLSTFVQRRQTQVHYNWDMYECLGRFSCCLLDEAAHWLRRLYANNVCPTPARERELLRLLALLVYWLYKVLQLKFLLQFELYAHFKAFQHLWESPREALAHIEPIHMAWGHLFVHWTVAIGCLW